MLAQAIDVDSLDVERIYLAGELNVLGDAPSRAPIDREIARQLPTPLEPIRKFIQQMFWAPDEVAGSTLSLIHI